MPSLVTPGGATSTAITVLASGTITADGTEQNILNRTLEENEKIGGWLSLNNMQADDILTVRTRINDVVHGDQDYNDAAVQPWVFIEPQSLLSGDTYRVTIEQTAGPNRDYDYKIFKE